MLCRLTWIHPENLSVQLCSWVLLADKEIVWMKNRCFLINTDSLMLHETFWLITSYYPHYHCSYHEGGPSVMESEEHGADYLETWSRHCQIVLSLRSFSLSVGDTFLDLCRHYSKKSNDIYEVFRALWNKGSS